MLRVRAAGNMARGPAAIVPAGLCHRHGVARVGLEVASGAAPYEFLLGAASGLSPVRRRAVLVPDNCLRRRLPQTPIEVRRARIVQAVPLVMITISDNSMEARTDVEEARMSNPRHLRAQCVVRSRGATAAACPNRFSTTGSRGSVPSIHSVTTVPAQVLRRASLRSSGGRRAVESTSPTAVASADGGTRLHLAHRPVREANPAATGTPLRARRPSAAPDNDRVGDHQPPPRGGIGGP